MPGYIDAQFERLLSWLARRGVTDRTLIVVAGDHGEGLGDHGELTHGLLLYQPTLLFGLRSNVKGFAWNPMGYLDFAAITK